jgi:hypothetical protein
MNTLGESNHVKNNQIDEYDQRLLTQKTNASYHNTANEN